MKKKGISVFLILALTNCSIVSFQGHIYIAFIFAKKFTYAFIPIPNKYHKKSIHTTFTQNI